MRSVWRQTARPKLSHALLPREPIRSLPTRQPTITIPHRAVTFSDVFVVFLAPFLAAATIVNLSWKEKQKKDWEVKFEQINQEIELLRQRELDAWSRLQIRSVRRGAQFQRRLYSTAAAASRSEPDGIEAQLPNDAFAEEELAPSTDTTDLIATAHTQEQDVESFLESLSEAERIASQQDIDALKRFERLLAYKLALHMILHVQLGLNPRRSELYQRNWFEHQRLPGDIDSIIGQLKQITTDLIKAFSSIRFARVPHSDLVNDERKRLHRTIWDLGCRMNTDEISASQLISGFAKSLLESTEAPTCLTYAALLNCFSKHRYEGFASLVYSTMLQNRTPLGDSAIMVMLSYLGHTRNTRAFDSFVRELTSINGEIQVQNRWQLQRVLDHSIPVPCTPSPRMLDQLMFVAMTCDQVDKAHSWFTVMQQNDFQGVEMMYALQRFLYFYAKQYNWVVGRYWVSRALQWAHETVTYDRMTLKEMNTLFFRILDICNACGRQDEYKEILKSLVNLGLEAPQALTIRKFEIRSPGQDDMYKRARRVREAWEQAFDERSDVTIQSAKEDILRSISQMQQLFVPPSRKEGHDAIDGSSLRASVQWKERFEKQQAELELLRVRLDDSKLSYAKLEKQVGELNRDENLQRERERYEKQVVQDQLQSITKRIGDMQNEDNSLGGHEYRGQETLQTHLQAINNQLQGLGFQQEKERLEKKDLQDQLQAMSRKLQELPKAQSQTAQMMFELAQMKEELGRMSVVRQEVKILRDIFDKANANKSSNVKAEQDPHLSPKPTEGEKQTPTGLDNRDIRTSSRRLGRGAILIPTASTLSSTAEVQQGTAEVQDDSGTYNESASDSGYSSDASEREHKQLDSALLADDQSAPVQDIATQDISQSFNNTFESSKVWFRYTSNAGISHPGTSAARIRYHYGGRKLVRRLDPSDPRLNFQGRESAVSHPPE